MTIRISEKDKERFQRMAEIENQLQSEGYINIAGGDEAGRGPLAGPVTAAFCILDPKVPIYGLNDSKKISPKRREVLAQRIKDSCVAYSIQMVEPAIIDEVNILEASKLSMINAVNSLTVKPDYLLIDALRLETLLIPQRAVTKGDANVNAIAAASILAKTARDQFMIELSEKYPEYHFEKHKGYGTALHYEALREHGPCPAHRLTFLKKLKLGKSFSKTTSVGNKAEERVAKHLKEQGFTILEKQFMLHGFGEIDLIAKRDNFLYIIEVKARQEQELFSMQGEELALAAVDKQKRRKMRILANYYHSSRSMEDYNIILLVAACKLDETQEVASIHFIPFE